MDRLILPASGMGRPGLRLVGGEKPRKHAPHHRASGGERGGARGGGRGNITMSEKRSGPGFRPLRGRSTP